MKLSKAKLEIAMAAACMNAYDVCEKADVPYPTFSKAKRGGACKPATVGKVAKALGVDVMDILQEI